MSQPIMKKSKPTEICGNIMLYNNVIVGSAYNNQSRNSNNSKRSPPQPLHSFAIPFWSLAKRNTSSGNNLGPS